MVQGRLVGLKSAEALPSSVVVSQDVVNDVNRVLALIPDAAAVSQVLTDYLIAHGENSEDDAKTMTFDLGKHLFAKLNPRNAETEAALRQAFSHAHLAIASNDDGDAHDDGMSVSPKFSSQDDTSLSLLVHPCGSIRRAVATGFAVRLLVGLKPTKSSDVALSRLQPQALLANTFYVGDNGHYSVDEAVKAASKRLHVSVTNLPDSEFFDIAEGVVLYNPSHYWSLMTTCDIPLRQDDESTPADGGTDAEGKPVRLMALWRSRWFVALELVRRLLYARDYGAFFVGSPFLLLSGRFSMEVPEFPLLKLEDRQGNIFEAILNRVDRVTVQKFGAFLQRAVAKGSIEYAVRQAKVAGVIRAIGEAIGSIRTPIKTVDLCLQTLTIIAQNVRCHRPQSLFFHELFPSGFAGDLMEHGFVTASGRSDDSLGLPIPSLITKNFLHRRDAWAVLSHLHPTFVHINERLVQEACRRALPQHFLSQENANPKQHNSQADESSPTHYRSSDDLFMIASAMVILSHATTNVNARRNQLSNLRPCIAQLIAGILETLRSGHTKIPGWVSQQTRLALSSIRIVKAVLEDWIAESKETTTGLDAANDTKPKVTSPIYPTLLADIGRVIDAAPLLSSLTSTALQVVELLIQESLSNDVLSSALSFEKVDTDTAGNPLALIVATIQRRFLDVGFDDDCVDHTTLTDVTIKDDILKSVLSILLTICLKLNNIGDAGSVAISLGVHQCHDWGLELVAAINNGGVPTPSSLLEVTGDRAANNSAAAPATTKQRSETDDHATAAAAPTASFVASQSWKQLAVSSHAVYVELFDRCDVTSIAAAASALGQLLKLQPELSISFEHLFSRSTLWLGKPIYELLEGEERRLEAELGEEGKGLINTSRNAILCGFLELVKTFVSSPTVASDDETVPALCALVQHFRQDVPYLNHLLQALLNAVSNGAKRSAYHPHRTLLRSVADASKTSGKLSTKLFAILDDKEKKHKSGGKETTQNEASSTNPSLAGFAIIARSVSASKKPIIAKEDSARKIIRSSLSKAKDAQRSDEAGRKKRAAAEQAEERQNNNANYNRGALYSDQPQQQRQSSRAPLEAAPRTEEIAASNGKDAKGNTKKMVSMRGDDDGINLDLLTLRIAQKQKTTDAPQERPAKPTSWANVAKSAKTLEEREDEANRAAAAEEERLQKAAAERAVRRKAAQDEEKRNQQDSDRRYRLEEEVKRNRGAIDVVDDFNPRPSPSTVDVHALLNMVLTAPGSVIRKAPAAEPQRQQASVIPRLTTVDDEEVGLGTVPSLSANAAIASLAQLRLGTEGSTVVHRAAYTSAATVQQAPHHQQQQTPPQQSPLNALLQAPNNYAHQQPQAHHYQQQQAQQLQSQLPPPPPQSLSKDSSMPSYFTTATNPTTNREVDGSIWHAEASLGAGYSTGQHHHAGVPSSLQQQRVAPPPQQQQQQHIFPTPHHHHHHHHIPQQQQQHQRGQFEEWGVQSAAPATTTVSGGARRSPPAQGNPWAHIPPPQQQQNQLQFPQSNNNGFPLGGGGHQHHHHHHYSNSVAPPPSFTQQQQHQHTPSTSLFNAPPSSSSYTTSVMAPPPGHLQQQQRQPHQVPPPHPQQQRVWLPGMNPQGGQNIAPPVRDIRVGGAPPNGMPPGASPYGGGAGPNGAPLHHMPPHQPPQPSVSVGFQNLSQQRPALPTTVTVGGRQAGAPWPPMSQPAPGFPQQVPSITIGGRAPPTAATLQQLPLSQPPQGVRVGHSQNGGDSAPAPNPYASATTTGNFGF